MSSYAEVKTDILNLYNMINSNTEKLMQFHAELATFAKSRVFYFEKVFKISEKYKKHFYLTFS